MNNTLIVLFALFATIAALANVTLLANGSLLDGSRALAQGFGIGASVNGSATAFVNETLSASSVTITAVGPTSTPTPTPTPSPSPSPQETSSVVIIQSRPALEKCSSIKNETCSDIKKYSGCGFCIESKYPLVGSGCAYKKQMMKMDAASKKYDVVVAIECECKGTYIMKVEDCPDCDSALKELLTCAKVSVADVVEIPAGCLEKVGVSVDYLTKCGFIQKAESAPAKKEKSPVVVVEKTPVYTTKEFIVVHPSTSPSPSPSPSPASPSAIARASASATSSMTGVTANASAMVSASGNANVSAAAVASAIKGNATALVQALARNL
eukprot:TRINITY_DN2165_c0_g1_i1.p1 TRINITY_DN2165_c0_g1~~TRINITY_DN2165_c0_g1_i1.p1  ORF type:complete len:325 (-),score=62.77 TRINITY_DN2165_c0_g1_i1:408-1382(-)